MSNVLLQVQFIVGSLLELITENPDLVSELNFTQESDRRTFKESCDISDKEKLAKKIVPFLAKHSDSVQNLSSFEDYSNMDLVGSYQADDPRSGWWLIVVGGVYVHLPIGYPDVLSHQTAMERNATQEEGYIPPDQFDGLIVELDEYELDRLIEIFTVVSAKPKELTDEDFINIDLLCRRYNREEVETVADLLGEHIEKVSLLPQRSYLEVATYSPGVYVYSVDPSLLFNIDNTVISIRRNDGTHYAYHFKHGILNREPPFRINKSLHDSIMKDE